MIENEAVIERGHALVVSGEEVTEGVGVEEEGEVAKWSERGEDRVAFRVSAGEL